MFKKTISLGVFLGAIALQPVFANSGFYVGAGAGVSDANDRLTVTYWGENSNKGYTESYGSLGLIGSIYGGYDFSFQNNFNLGLEAFLTGSTNQFCTNYDENVFYHNEKYQTYYSNINLSSRYAFGVRALPGYKITPDVLGYVILGLARGGFRLADNNYFGNSSSNFGAYGYQLGLGGFAAIWNNLSARLDFIYTGYANTSVNGMYNSMIIQYQNNKLNSFSGILSLNYKFN